MFKVEIRGGGTVHSSLALSVDLGPCSITEVENYPMLNHETYNYAYELSINIPYSI